MFCSTWLLHIVDKKRIKIVLIITVVLYTRRVSMSTILSKKFAKNTPQKNSTTPWNGWPTIFSRPTFNNSNTYYLVLWFPLPSDNDVQHDLEHWSLITFPKKENLGNKKRKPMHQVYLVVTLINMNRPFYEYIFVFFLCVLLRFSIS